MLRLAILTLIAFSCVATAVVFSPVAHAGSRPTRISGQFGVAELYPKTLKRYRRESDRLARLKRAHRAAQARGAMRTMERIEASYRKTEASVAKAHKKLMRVKGVTTVIVWGDAGDKMPRDEIAAFLRKKRSWQGTTVHFYARQGKLKAGHTAPLTYDGSKPRPAARPASSVPGRIPTNRLSPGFIPQTRPLSGNNHAPGTGRIFGI